MRPNTYVTKNVFPRVPDFALVFQTTLYVSTAGNLEYDRDFILALTLTYSCIGVTNYKPEFDIYYY